MPTYVDPLKPKVPVAQPIGGPTLQPAAPAVNAGFGGAPAQPVPQPAPAPVAAPPAPVAPVGPTPATPRPGSAAAQMAKRRGSAGGLEDVFRNSLIGMMKQDPVDMNDPIVRAQSDAYSQAQQQGLEMTRAAMAERAGTEGTMGSGGYNADVQSAYENMGQNIASKNSSLLGDRLNQQRQEIQNALTTGGQYLSDQQKNALTLKLSQINDATQRLGLGVQERLGTGQLNLGMLQALLQNQQVGNAQGIDLSKFQWNANQAPWAGLFS